MITATLNTTPLNLPDDISFELIQRGQLCNFDTLKGDLVPSISFPNTEQNRNVLNHPNRYELVLSGVKEYSGFELRSNGERLIAGTLVLTDGFSGYVRGQVGNLSATQRDKLITDHTLEEDVAFTNKTNYDPSTDDYCCPEISNSAFWEGVGIIVPDYPRGDETYEETVFQHKHRNVSYRVNYKDAAGVLINNARYNTSRDDEETYQLTVVSPQLYLIKTLQKLLKLNGFYLNENEFDASHDFHKLCIYNNRDINSGGIHAATVRAYTENIDEERVLEVVGAISQVTRAITTFNYTDLLPKTSLKDFLVGFQNLTNSVFVFHNNGFVSLIDRETRLTGSSNNIDAYFLGKWEPGVKKDVALKFSMLHDSNDKLFADYYVDLSDRIDKFGADVNYFSDIENVAGAFLGELRRVKNEGRIYEWVSTVAINESLGGIAEAVHGWQFVSVDYQPGFYNYSAEKEVEEIKTCFSTLLGSQIPQAKQMGDTILRKKDSTPFSPRVLFYTGNGDGRNNTTNYDLSFTGDKSIIDTRYRKTAQWWSTRHAWIGYCKFPNNIRQSLDLNQKQRTRHGEFVIDKMTTTITHSGAGVSKLEVFKVD